MRQDTCVLWLEEGIQGPRCVDVSKHINNGWMVGGQWKEDAIYLDGVDDFVFFGNHSSLDITNYMTMEALVYLTKEGTFNGNVGCKRTDAAYGWYFYLGGDRTIFVRGGGAPSVFSTGPLNLNQWYHLVATFNSTTGLIYIDGALDNSGSISPVTSQPSIRVTVGARWTTYPSTTSFFGGKIKLFRLYNSVLTAQQVKELYEQSYKLV